MNAGDWLLVAMIVLYVAAAIAYALDGQLGKVMYFAGATVLSFGILWMEG